jgi:hypothetical protein
LVRGVWTTREAAERAQAVLLGETAQCHINGTKRNAKGVVSRVTELPTNTLVEWDMWHFAQPKV